ncbi:MAG: hypothetical protein ABI863_01905 [Ginsengibacter sp.]
MSEDLNNDAGRISGKSNQDNFFESRITGNKVKTADTDGRIEGNKVTGSSTDAMDASPARQAYGEKNVLTRKQRIALATEEKGLKSLPSNFGDSDGDWQVIESDDLFEVLYLDQEKIIIISPEIAKNNFTLLEKFWKEKRNLWESGSGQIRKTIEDKYGAKNLANSAKKIESALEQLFTLEKINEYYARLREQRIRTGEIKLEPFLKMMFKDGTADPNEIEGIIEEGLQHNLNTEEIAGIIKKAIDTRGFMPYGNPSGRLLSEQLLSVSWMNDESTRRKREEDEEKKKRGREIFDNVYAYSVDEIGAIIFNNEKESKLYITNGLLKNSIDYFSPAKANQFNTIIGTQKNEHLRYLQVAYRLNPQLPYRFNALKIVKSPKELVDTMFETPESFKVGKEQFKNGYPELWFLETNKEAYAKLVNIRDKSENPDTAFISFIYTFNPALPYRFDELHLVRSGEELCFEINKNNKSWDAGKKELFNATIPTWLSTAKQSPVPAKWNQVKDSFNTKKDLGLEYFLHLLNDRLVYTKLAVDKNIVTYPKIPSGQVVKTDLIFSNETRGYLEGYLKFLKDIPGVTLSNENFVINNIMGSSNTKVSLIIDSNVLLKGVSYATDIEVKTFEQQKINIPVTFKIVFPRNAFILEIAKYSVIFAAFFVFIRFILSSTHHGWLSADYNYFLGADEAFFNYSNFALFGWTFFLFISCSATGIYFLIKYLFKNVNK